MLEALAGPQPGIFISHIAEEKTVALVLQKYLRLAFGSQVPVFVATDKQSIEPGKKWFDYIISQLRQHKVLISLLSQESRRREWINFEAGFADGAEALVVPMMIKGFPLGGLSFPLAGYQGLTIDDIGQLIGKIGDHLGLTPTAIDQNEYFDDIRHAEAELTYKSLTLSPYFDSSLSDSTIYFALQNIGNVDLELLMVETYIPIAIVSKNWVPGASYGFDYQRVHKWECDHDWCACYSPRGAHSGIVPTLRPVITPSMGSVALRFFHIVLKQPLDETERSLEIRYQIHAVNYSTRLESFRVREIPIR